MGAVAVDDIETDVTLTLGGEIAALLQATGEFLEAQIILVEPKRCRGPECGRRRKGQDLMRHGADVGWCGSDCPPPMPVAYCRP